MELSGHPTQDLVEELIDRGAVIFDEGPSGPDLDSTEARPAGRGQWLWVPEEAFDTGVDEAPGPR